MTRHIEARFEIGSWDETPFEDSFEDSDEDAKLTEALVVKAYSGDIKGTSTTKWLMAYAPDKTAMFVGIERIKARSAASTAVWCCFMTVPTGTAPRQPPCKSLAGPKS